MKSAPFIGDGAGWEGWMEEESYIKYQEKGVKEHTQETFGHPKLNQLTPSFPHLPFQTT